MPVSGVSAAVDVVVLSQGDRLEETRGALESARAQEGIETHLFLVGNGWRPEGFGPHVHTLHLEENVGAPGGRNVGAAAGDSELIFFLDNDAWLPDTDTLRRAAEMFAADPHLGLVHPRVSDPDGTTMRRWVPRARTGDPAVGGPAFSAAEGVIVLRRRAFEEAGGFPAIFFFGHEGIELAWRLRDRGWDLRYEPSLTVHHPATEASRHSTFWRLTARNRVWVARRNLPWPLAATYVAAWTAVTVARTWRDPASLKVWFGGFREGVTTDPGDRRPMSWRTVFRLTRLGQPPVM